MKNVMDMTDTEYLAECERLAGEYWLDYSGQYSFLSAKAEGMSPAGAVKDCKEWLES